jgi:hypothetical protein
MPRPSPDHGRPQSSDSIPIERAEDNECKSNPSQDLLPFVVDDSFACWFLGLDVGHPLPRKGYLHYLKGITRNAFFDLKASARPRTARHLDP